MSTSLNGIDIYFSWLQSLFIICITRELYKYRIEFGRRLILQTFIRNCVSDLSNYKSTYPTTSTNTITNPEMSDIAWCPKYCKFKNK